MTIAFSFCSIWAADRHVFLDTDSDGKLNDCPNPAHNAKGTSNTDTLNYCSGGSASGKIIGTASGRVSSSGCTGGGGAVAPVQNGSLVDIDGDGTLENVYGHPQACVYNMAKSDSCEVHAGTYSAPGARCTSFCGDFNNGGGAPGTPMDWNSFFATVTAWGYGPNLNGTGYGTAASPGYLRGAQMNGSTDTWDPNGDKNPADKQYAAVLSGNSNVGITDGGFDMTSCTETTCTGDSYFAVLVGCGGADAFGAINCSSRVNQPVYVDTDANGTFDTPIGLSGTRRVDYFVIKDIEFTGYNQGNGSTNESARHKEANINLNGDGNSDGLKIDHIYLHDNGHGTDLSVAEELFWSHIADMRNSGCVDSTEIKDSLLYQNNHLLFEDDGGQAPSRGCSSRIHDNRIVVDIKVGSPLVPALAYWKTLDYHVEDGRPKVIRFYNNEVIYKQMSNSGNKGWFIDLEEFGNSGGHGKGEIWVYGNIFRVDPSFVNKIQWFLPTFCSEDAQNQTSSWRFYYFNNTWDGWSAAGSTDLNNLCSVSGSTDHDGEIYVGKNNVEVWTTNEQATDTAATLRISNNRADDASKCSGTSRYFQCGTAPTTHGGLAYYEPFATGGLRSGGSCDPDGDGVPGVDYDGNGTNDTTWRDIAGHLVSCPSLTTSIDVGAIQSSAAPPSNQPPENVNGLRRTDRRNP